MMATLVRYFYLLVGVPKAPPDIKAYIIALQQYESYAQFEYLTKVDRSGGGGTVLNSIKAR